MSQILIRFLVGGAFVSAFAIIGDLLKPKSFAGLFGAAPSVELATLGLTISTEGASYAVGSGVATMGRASTVSNIEESDQSASFGPALSLSFSAFMV